MSTAARRIGEARHCIVEHGCCRALHRIVMVRYGLVGCCLVWAMYCNVELGVAKQRRSTVGFRGAGCGKVSAAYCKVRYRKVRALHSSVEFSAGTVVHRWTRQSLGNAGISFAYQCVAQAACGSVSLCHGVVPLGYAMVQLSSAAPRVAQVKQSLALPRLSRVEHRAVRSRRGTVELCVVPAEYG